MTGETPGDTRRWGRVRRCPPDESVSDALLDGCDEPAHACHSGCGNGFDWRFDKP